MDDEHLSAPAAHAEPSDTPLPADVRQLLLGFVRFLARVGHDPISTAAWYAYFAASAQRAHRPEIALADSALGAVAQAALARWLCLPEYQERATPQSLPMSGPGPSIAALIGETPFKGKEFVVLEYWLAAGAVRDLGNERFIPVMRNFRPPTLDHRRAQMVRTLMAVLSIMEENSNDSEMPSSASFQHMVSVPGLPRSDQHAIASGVAHSGLAFLNFQECSLLSRVDPPAPAEGAMEVGVIVFAGEVPKTP